MMPVSHQLSARLPGRGYATPMQRPGRPARRLAAPPKAFDLSAIDLSAIQTSFAEAAAYKAPPSEEATASVGIALGLLGLSFVGTFLVLPRFSSLFKDEIQWNDIYPELVEGGAEEVDAAEAAAMTKRGAIIVDVRLEQKRQNYAIEKSVSAPLYRPITGMGLVSNLRRFGFGFFGVYGTERNPDFLAELEKNAEKDQQVILVCEMGGSLEQKPGATTGFQSRSLKAMHIARKAGFKKLYYLKNGVSAWARMESPEGVETEKLQGVSS